MRHALLLLGIVATVPISTALAQENTLWPHIAGVSSSGNRVWSLGLEIGGRIDALSMRAQGASDGSLGDLFSSGAGAGASISTYIEYGVSPTIGLQASVRWDRRRVDGSGSTLADCFVRVNDVLPPLLVDTARVDNDFTLMQSFVSVGIAGRWSIAPDVWFTAGPTLDVPIGNGTFRIRQRMADNVDCAFRGPDGQPTREVESTFTSSPTKREFHLGGNVSFGYRRTLLPGLGLLGRLNYAVVVGHSMGVSDFTDNTRELSRGIEKVSYTDALIHSLSGSVGLVLDF